jgi:micrococcal nuclease
MRRLILALAVSGALIAPGIAAEPSTLTGTVTHVRDGDTIEVSEVPIRLHGVSAPELDEPLGPQSKKFMHELVLGQPVRCELNGQKTYDRFVGTCYLGGKDIGISIIEAGLALDCPRYSGRRYAEFEKTAARENIELPGYCS